MPILTLDKQKGRKLLCFRPGVSWSRGLDLNQRPSGYEPDELPDCSTPQFAYTSVRLIIIDATHMQMQELFSNFFAPANQAPPQPHNAKTHTNRSVNARVHIAASAIRPPTHANRSTLATPQRHRQWDSAHQQRPTSASAPTRAQTTGAEPHHRNPTPDNNYFNTS